MSGVCVLCYPLMQTWAGCCHASRVREFGNCAAFTIIIIIRIIIIIAIIMAGMSVF